MNKIGLLSFWVLLLLLGCGSDDNSPQPEPEPPSAAALIFPLQNSECTTGVDVGNGASEVTFEWHASENTDFYTLDVVNLETNTLQTIGTSFLSATLTIEKGAPFSWSVTSTNEGSDVTVISETWLFYNAGPQRNYAPFPAQIIFPKSGRTVQMNASNELVLEWSGTDVEDDITAFEVYFSNTSAQDLSLVQSGMETTYTATDMVSQTTYYWKIVTIDAQGNTSDSGIFDFKIL